MKSIFIVGHARSGTTLIYNHITAAFGLSAFPETHFFSKLWPAYQSGKSTVELQAEFFDEVIMTDSEFSEFDSMGECYQAFVKKFTIDRATLNDHICEKTPGHIHTLDEIYTAFPDAVTIVIVRDPVNTIASEKAVGEWYSNASKRAKRWVKGYAKALNYVETKPSSLRVIAFEDFINNPQKVIGSLQDFLGLEAREQYDPDDSHQYSVCDFEKWKQVSSAKIVKNKGKPNQLTRYERWTIGRKTNKVYQKLLVKINR